MLAPKAAQMPCMHGVLFKHESTLEVLLYLYDEFVFLIYFIFSCDPDN